MATSNRLLDHYLPPREGFFLESLVATTYQVDFQFLEEELLTAALGVRAPTSRMRALRSELERRLQQQADVTVLYDLAGCERLARLSPRIDALPVSARKLHAKVSVQLWTRPDPAAGRPPDRRLRLVVGSANLTRQGFRENYECVTALDYGEGDSAPPGLLRSALALLREVGAETTSEQLRRQLDQFEAEAARLPAGRAPEYAPLRFVRGEEVVAALQEAWGAVSSGAPVTAIIVSPFWPEGDGAADSLAELVEALGPPQRIELACRGAPSVDGRSWLPEIDGEAVLRLRERLGCSVALRAARPDYGVLPSAKPDEGDETEDEQFSRHLGAAGTASPADARRALHAKMIVLSGPKGAALYAGSSNCTRRGLGLGGPRNWEAGLVYWVGPRRDLLDQLLAFAGPPVEVTPGNPVVTRKPDRRDESPAPRFLAEVTLAGTTVTVRFREGEAVPPDLRVLMEDPAAGDDRRYWLLYRAADRAGPEPEAMADLRTCPRCDASEVVVAADRPEKVAPNVQVEVRWQGVSPLFPVRFLNKTELPLLLLGRKPSEGELIDYFLFGREPAETEDELAGRDKGAGRGADDPLDTRRILAYFMRRFVQAISGIEAEIERAAYGRKALEAALRGTTSPLALAEHAAASLTRPRAPDEPTKSPTAVGFQLVEILAALGRSRERVQDPELQACFDPVMGRCRELLDALALAHPELRASGFRRYRAAIGEGR
jgi:hypothetical protein